MIVIADTTPVSYLILINEINILALLYGRVIIPMAVFEELRKFFSSTGCSDLDGTTPGLATGADPRNIAVHRLGLSGLV